MYIAITMESDKYRICAFTTRSLCICKLKKEGGKKRRESERVRERDMRNTSCQKKKKEQKKTENGQIICIKM